MPNSQRTPKTELPKFQLVRGWGVDDWEFLVELGVVELGVVELGVVTLGVDSERQRVPSR